MTINYKKSRSDKFLDANVSIVEFESKRVVGANFFAEVDLTQIENIRDNSTRNPNSRRLPYTAFVVSAVAKALSEFPYANGRLFPRFPKFIFGRTLVRFKQCDIAVAVERSQDGMEGTAFCDVLRTADQLSLPEISEWLLKLSQADMENNKQWREFSNTIRTFPRWLAALMIRLPCFFPSLWVKYRGGAALISSPAKYGVDVVAATWVWPIGVSFGLAKQRAVVKNNQVVACPTFTLTLSFDRRMMAGAQAARFFKRIVELLESGQIEPREPST